MTSKIKTLILLLLLPITIGMSKYRFLLTYPDAMPKGMISNKYTVVSRKDTTIVYFTGDTVCKVETRKASKD